VDWECGGRDKVTCERLIERLKRWGTRLYCTDDYAVYDVLPVGQRYSGKNETHGIERDNARQRHWLARFRRRSIVVSKAKRMVDVSLALFACFAGNSKIGDLVSMLVILAKPEAIRLACSGFERGLAGMEWRAGL
jgi:insertion element IS1 protein InsB